MQSNAMKTNKNDNINNKNMMTKIYAFKKNVS